MKDPCHIDLQSMAQWIYDKKGESLLALDVRGVSELTDFVLIAEGHVERHVIAIARFLSEKVKESLGLYLIHSEGLREGDWVVLDYGAIMVHLFAPEMRRRYALERLWSQSRIVPLAFTSSLEDAQTVEA